MRAARSARLGVLGDDLSGSERNGCRFMPGEAAGVVPAFGRGMRGAPPPYPPPRGGRVSVVLVATRSFQMKREPSPLAGEGREGGPRAPCRIERTTPDAVTPATPATQHNSGRPA